MNIPNNPMKEIIKSFSKHFIIVISKTEVLKIDFKDLLKYFKILIKCQSQK